MTYSERVTTVRDYSLTGPEAARSIERAAVRRPAHLLRDLVGGLPRYHPTRRVERGCARPSAQQPHGSHESDLLVLHAEIRDDLPEPCSSTLAAYSEIFTAARAQRNNPLFELERTAEATPGGPPRNDVAGVIGDGAEVEAKHVGDDGWVTVCPASELGRGELRRLDTTDGTYAVCRTLDGALHAVDGICTHSRVAHLAGGAVVGVEIECPKHNGRFALVTGEPTRSPVTRGVGVYRTVEEAGEVRVWVGGGDQFREPPPNPVRNRQSE